eukprot:15452185-Alexandrium_andersonii.AAC.1
MWARTCRRLGTRGNRCCRGRCGTGPGDAWRGPPRGPGRAAAAEPLAARAQGAHGCPPPLVEALAQHPRRQR